MIVIPIYRYVREDGGITVSPEKPDMDSVEKVRLIAEDGKILSNGVVKTYCQDVDTIEGWIEEDAPIKEHIDG